MLMMPMIWLYNLEIECQKIIMKQLDCLNRPAGRGRPPKYRWSEILDGRRRELTQGLDFESTAGSFQQLVWSTARRHGLTARTRRFVNADGVDCVEVEVLPA